jgi:hypothetical protein
LALLQHPPQLNPCQGGMRGPKRFEAEHGSNYSLDEPMILLDNIVQVFTLANLNPSILVSVELFDAGCIGAAFRVSSGRGRNDTLSPCHRFIGHLYSPVRRI